MGDFSEELKAVPFLLKGICGIGRAYKVDRIDGYLIFLPLAFRQDELSLYSDRRTGEDFLQYGVLVGFSNNRLYILQTGPIVDLDKGDSLTDPDRPHQPENSYGGVKGHLFFDHDSPDLCSNPVVHLFQSFAMACQNPAGHHNRSQFMIELLRLARYNEEDFSLGGQFRVRLGKT